MDLIMIKGIYTLRNIKNDFFRDVVYEWEDVISETLSLPLLNTTEKTDKNVANSFIGKVARKAEWVKPFKKFDLGKDLYIAFCTIAVDVLYFQDLNCIPIFCDIWNDNMEFVANKMKSGVPFVVTSLDVYNKLMALNKNLNVHYMPLSISDKWKLNDIPEKQIDVIQMGRKNDKLNGFMLRYCEAHPDVDYVYSSIGGTTETSGYSSTKRGNIGNFELREDYMAAMKSTKVCLVSSTTVDNTNSAKDGINFPTPRFYEAAVNYCFMLGRYTTNEEFVMQKIPLVCAQIAEYSDIEKCLDDIFYGGKEIDRRVYDEYIHMHATSTWANELSQWLETFVTG